MKNEAASSFEKLVTIYQTARYNIPEDNTFNTHSRENLGSRRKTVITMRTPDASFPKLLDDLDQILYLQQSMSVVFKFVLLNPFP
jgi:hypothetical protein